MELYNKNVLVYGTGLSGKSAVSFLLELGANVYIFNDNSFDLIENTISLNDLNDIGNFNIDLCVISPGVDILGNRNVGILNKNNIQIISELYLGLNFIKGKTICITGTNGKTTTVNLIYEILKCAKKQVFLCGNTKCPITSIANQTTNNSITVCEVSSFALETTPKIKPNVASILNITEDHIQRHHTFENYVSEKTKITKYQDNQCFFIKEFNRSFTTNAKVICYSLKENFVDCYVFDGHIYFKNKKLIKVDKIKIKGRFNLLNIMCAICCASVFNIKLTAIKKAILDFQPLSHRLEFVKNLHGVKYINDSKATNPDSTIKALSVFNEQIILILGGLNKGLNFDGIFKNCQNVKQIIAFGDSRKLIKKQAKEFGINNVIISKYLKDATIIASTLAQNGDVVLFSPSCSSFDQFNSYSQRGDFFKKIVGELK